MKGLSQYIIESLKPEELFVATIKGNKFSKEQLINMLNNMDMKTLNKVSDNFKTEYNDNYFPYEPGRDEFLKQSNKPDIINKISDFILKYVCA
jgi:hypothetical protein